MKENILVAARRHFPLALFAMLGSAVGTQILLNVNSEIFKGLLWSRNYNLFIC